MKTRFDEQINYIIATTQEYETAPDWALTIKLSEEHGEFSEAMLKNIGFLKHKKQEPDELMHEAADMILVLLAALAKHFPEDDPKDIAEALSTAIDTKMEKYKRLLGVE